MPTGYTADLEGVTFPEFALRCARAFGALITMRDESSDTPIPDCIEPSNYSRKQLTVAVESLLQVESWNEDCAETVAEAAYAQALQTQEARLQKSEAPQKRYEAMMSRVVHWTPPTVEHTGLKDFMLEQLTKSIKFDCSGGFSELTSRSGQEHKHHQLCAILKDIEYHAKNYREELERSRGRTDWIRQLRVSLRDQS